MMNWVPAQSTFCGAEGNSKLTDRPDRFKYVHYPRFISTLRSGRRGRNRSVKHKRIIVTHYGGPEELRVLEEERPEPKQVKCG